MTVLVVVQARMGSTRLPGKVLRPLGGRPMLQFQIERLRAGLPADWRLVVATSVLSHDDPVADLAASLDVPAVRGDEGDVLSRFIVAMDTVASDTVVRLTGDCPLSDPEIVRSVVALHAATNARYSSNVYPRSYPRGLDVEVMASDALRAAASEAQDPIEREHVTPFLVRRPSRFPMATLFSGEDLGEESWTVDRHEDLELVRRLVAALDDPISATWRDVLAVAGRRNRSPRMIHLRPLPPPEPGSAPWVRTWQALRGVETVGTASVAVDDGGRATFAVDANGDTDDVRQALDELLRDDVQISRRGPR